MNSNPLIDAENACCFSGHRAVPREERGRLESALQDAIVRLIVRGVTDFVAGGALGFDSMAAKTVLRLKERFPQIRLLLVLPCGDQDKRWHDRARAEYRRILSYADEVLILSEMYYDGCMQKRNRRMVDECRYLICYQRSKAGGTAYTVRYAREKGREIINLACEEPRLF